MSAGQWSPRYCFLPIDPDEDPDASCLDDRFQRRPREALGRHFALDPESVARAPAERLFRTGPDEPARLASGQDPSGESS